MICLHFWVELVPPPRFSVGFLMGAIPDVVSSLFYVCSTHFALVSTFVCWRIGILTSLTGRRARTEGSMVHRGGVFAGVAWVRAVWALLVVTVGLTQELSMKGQDDVHYPIAPAGILFFGYGSDEDTAALYVEQARESALRIKALNPTVNITVVCNPGVEPPDMGDAFDMAIQIDQKHLHDGKQQAWGPKGVSRQWLTRLEYLARSPYEVTMALDSQALCCAADVSNVLKNFMWEGFDVAFAVQGPRNLGPHNWALMYRLNFNTRRLFQRWRNLQIDYSTKGSDQQTLYMAAGSLALQGKINVGILSESVAMATVTYSRTAPEHPKTSGLVDPLPVHFIHYEAGSDEDAERTCSTLNSEAGRARVVVLPRPGGRDETGAKLGDKFEIAYSEEELATVVHAVREDAEYFRGLDWENLSDKWGHVATPWHEHYPDCWEDLAKEVNSGVRRIYRDPPNLEDCERFVLEFGDDFLEWPAPIDESP